MKHETGIGEEKANLFHSVLYLELIIKRSFTVIISIFYRFCCKLSYKEEIWPSDYSRQSRPTLPRPEVEAFLAVTKEEACIPCLA